jgi:hypothetical protein
MNERELHHKLQHAATSSDISELCRQNAVERGLATRNCDGLYGAAEGVDMRLDPQKQIFVEIYEVAGKKWELTGTRGHIAWLKKELQKRAEAAQR